MSILAKYTQVTVPIPHDSDQTVTIQKLSGRELEDAELVHLENYIKGKNGRGWIERYTEAVTNGVASDGIAKLVLSDPLRGVDRFTVVRYGLKGWSYPDAITPEVMDRLDDETAEFIAREVMRLTRPALFQTPDEAEAARKNA
jgi:hypothetical protein